jgi:hypothetical protein
MSVAYLPMIAIYTSWYVDEIRPNLSESEKNKACVMQRLSDDEIRYFTIDIRKESIQNLKYELQKRLNKDTKEIGVVSFHADKSLNEQVVEALDISAKLIGAVCVGGYFNNGRFVNLIDNEKKSWSLGNTN